MEEIWKEIKNYEGYFEVSNLGNFRSKDRIVGYKQSGLRKYPGKTLKVEQTKEGYCRIVLTKNGNKKRYMCHRIVAETFISNTENKPQINHIDGRKNNNIVSNLEWVTQSENERHSIDSLGKSMRGKTKAKPVKCIENNIIFQSMSEAIRFIGKTSCIEGLNKAIKSSRLYHGYTFNFL